MKAQTILLYLGILSYILAIVEKLSNLGILNWLYSTVDKATVLYLLVILGTAFIVTYFIDSKLRRQGVGAGLIRYRPPWAAGDYDYKSNDYRVEWHIFVPPSNERDSLPWADGPYCPKCKRDLEEERVGVLFKKTIWFCLLCKKIFSLPEGDVKKMVEKNLAAYLRKKGEL